MAYPVGPNVVIKVLRSRRALRTRVGDVAVKRNHVGNVATDAAASGSQEETRKGFFPWSFQIEPYLLTPWF